MDGVIRQGGRSYIFVCVCIIMSLCASLHNLLLSPCACYFCVPSCRIAVCCTYVYPLFLAFLTLFYLCLSLVAVFLK